MDLRAKKHAYSYWRPSCPRSDNGLRKALSEGNGDAEARASEWSGAVYGLVYALSTAGIPFITRKVFGSKGYDRVYSAVIAVFNGIGAFGVTAWALIQENAGWDGCFIAAIGLTVIMLILGLYIAIRGYKLREDAANAWYTPEVELQQTGRIRKAERRAAYIAAHPEAGGKLEPAVEKG